VERRQASAPASGRAAQAAFPWRDPRAACARDMKHCVCRRSASLICFVLSYFVIAGLDPAIHAAAKLF